MDRTLAAPPHRWVAAAPVQRDLDRLVRAGEGGPSKSPAFSLPAKRKSRQGVLLSKEIALTGGILGGTAMNLRSVGYRLSALLGFAGVVDLTPPSAVTEPDPTRVYPPPNPPPPPPSTPV